MYYPRHYCCMACGKKFTLSDGMIVQPSAGVPCPHCGSHKTKERIISGMMDFVKHFIKSYNRK